MKNIDKLNEKISIPSDINFDIENNKITMKKENKEIEKKIDSSINLSKEDNEIILSMDRAKKDERRSFGTAKSHIKNMIEGLEKGYEYDLEICNVHFPITVTFDKAKSEVVIKNFLGEKFPRVLKIDSKNVDIEIKAPFIKIKSHDIEKAGQIAASIEKLSRIRNRDRNKFQDGIFITKKPGRIFI